MMAKINAQILADLQQLMQIIPHFLATLSQYIHAPQPPQLPDNPHCPETDQTPPKSQM